MPMACRRNAACLMAMGFPAAIACRMWARARNISFWPTGRFRRLQPYAETGPIFLHAKACARADDAHETPAMLARRAAHLIKGYSSDDRIVYGTGKIVPSAELDAEAANILKRDDVAYVHVRSSVNNCYTCRIERA